MVSIKAYLFLLSLFILVSCQTGPKISIESNVPARIEAQGNEVCSETPCTIDGYHYRDGYNFGCVQGGETRLEAFPLNQGVGFRQSKVVFGECNQLVNVFFDMNSGGLINTIAQEKISTPQTISTLTEKLSTLQELYKKGLITASEYAEKKRELLREIK